MDNNNNTLSLLFCGDFSPCRRWYDYGPNTSVFGDALDFINNCDLSFINLECPATNIGKQILKDGPNLRTKPEWLVPLKEAGFNLVGLANNHIRDYGEEAVLDCINSCKKVGLNTVGAGNNLKEAQKVFFFEKNNIKIAIIAVCEHEFSIAERNNAGTAPLDTIDNNIQINEAKQNADFIIITIHGGNELFPYPRPYLRKQCKFYIEQGCDAVICHHPHVPGAYEIYNEKPIFYSIGNFLFDNISSPLYWNEGYMVKLELTKKIPFNKNVESHYNKIKYELVPYTQSFEQGGIKLMTGSEKESFLNRIEDYINTLNNEEKYREVWKDFCESKKAHYLINQYCPFIFRGVSRIIKRLGVSKILLNNVKRLATRLNFIRCESHREVLLKILSDLLILRNEP